MHATDLETTQPYATLMASPAVLWISPNLNDYKARFLDVLTSEGGPKLTVLAGAADVKVGHKYAVSEHRFTRINIAALKSRFAFSPSVFRKLYQLIRIGEFDIVLMPMEKKHLPVILFLWLLSKLNRFRLVSYNHPCLRSSDGKVTRFNLVLTKLLFRLYDHVIFYTEASRTWAIKERLIRSEKASFASNTLDTDSIWKEHDFRVNRSKPTQLLFIGRLVPAKRLDLLIEYYEKLRREIADLQLDIVGDGPAAEIIVSAVEHHREITWHGAMSDETLIAERMDAAHAVFIPGHSGLSIVHSFCYGKPFITLTGPGIVQPPEIDYLQDGKNGLRLNQSEDENVSRIVDLLTDPDRYSAMCDAAINTARGITVHHWKQQVESAFRFAAGDAR